MWKQHFIDVIQEEREKSDVPEIEIQSCVESFAEVSKKDTFVYWSPKNSVQH